jgi:hypothetical protein
MDVPNESPPVTPFVNVYDAIDPAQLFFEDSLRDGVTSIHVIAANDCVIGGMSRVVHPIGMTPEEMTTAGQIAGSGARSGRAATSTHRPPAACGRGSRPGAGGRCRPGSPSGSRPRAGACGWRRRS